MDTSVLIDQFNDITSSKTRGVLMIASRPFSNVNHLRYVHNAVPVKVVESKVWEYDWWGGCGYKKKKFYLRDQSAVNEIKNTFNGPALLPNLLPPLSELEKRRGHPYLKGGKMESWKRVAGKLEALTAVSEYCFYDYYPDSFSKERRRQRQMSRFIDEFIEEKMTALCKHYPGGSKNYSQRCYSTYFVKIVRDSESQLRGYKVQWLSDHTFKDGQWSPKSSKSTLPIDEYKIYIHDDGTHFADWKSEGLKKQVADHDEAMKEYEETVVSVGTGCTDVSVGSDSATTDS